MTETLIPISGLVNPSEVTSDSDPALPTDSILIKWRPVVLGDAGIESWNVDNVMIIHGSVFMYWLVSISGEEIMGFIVQGESFSPLFSLTVPYPYLADLIPSTYLIYLIRYNLASSSSSRKLSSPFSHSMVDHRSLTISKPVFISPNKTLSSRTIREYVAGVSDQRFYLLNSGTDGR